MVSLILINVLVVLYFGMFALLIGFTDSIIQVFVLTTVSFYRKALCTFCFIIAAIHECGLFVTAYGSIVVSGFLDNQLARTSAVWCKLRYCLISSLCAASSVCGYLATIDQCLTTSQNVRFRHWSRPSPYGICYAYSLVTLNVETSVDRMIKENLMNNITYILCSLAYGGRFYLFMRRAVPSTSCYT
ncbi:unnamed protein product [Rotaria magnacalcarata]|nr:unnamed protein product [Rotaria magnacalcarata]CAF2173115.1 unnamed protein product [Rotaria magnacalcarata]